MSRCPSSAALIVAAGLFAAPIRAMAALTCDGIGKRVLQRRCQELSGNLDDLRTLQQAYKAALAAGDPLALQAAKDAVDARAKQIDLKISATLKDKDGFEDGAAAEDVRIFELEFARAQQMKLAAASNPRPYDLDLDVPPKGAEKAKTLSSRKEAQIALDGGHPGFAEKTLDQAIKRDPNDGAAFVLRAQARQAQGDRAGALADARRALQLNPEDQEAGRIVSDLQNLAEAQRKIDGIKVDFGPGRAPLKGAAGDATRAELPVRAGLVVPGAGMTVPPAGVAPPTVRDLFQQAYDKFQVNDDAGALMALHEAVDLDPNLTEAWDEIAEISNKDGDYEGAVAAAGKALAIKPDDARALRAKAYAEFQLGDYRRALADADRAVQLDPNNGLGYLYRAMAEEKLGDAAAAIRDYRTAARVDPALAPAALEGLARLEAGAPKKSRQPLLLRVGVLGGSGVLLLLGLLGTASGRRLARDYTRRLKTIVSSAPAEEPRGPVVVSEFSTVALGSVIGGHYRVTGELGRGGMGAVYRAQDETLNRPVAIKQLLRDGRGNPEDAARLLREARLVARLQHPNIAEIYSVITENDLLLVFEFVDGESLDKTLRRNKKLPPARARQIMTGVCAALDYAHARGIIHRDLKPGNVMLAADGAAKVMDFGIAHQSRGGGTLTKTMTASGTPPYMAPEQFLGSVSRAADLYSAAVMAYELLTGSRPFEGPDFVEPKLRKEFLPPSRLDSALPPAVDEFFARALEPDPLKRPASAVEFSRAFGAALAGAANPT